MIEKYEHEKHYSLVERWLLARGMKPQSKELFSNEGTVVNGNAIGFLFVTNSKQAYIDNFVSNPGASKEERDLALDELIENLEERAKFVGVKLLNVVTGLDSIKERFEKHGYLKNGNAPLYFKYVGGN